MTALITLGTDPELFALDHGKVLSAYQALGGNRDYQLTWGELTPDGAAVEFTVTPSGNPTELVSRMFRNIQETMAIVSAHGADRLVNTSVIDVSELIAAHPAELGERCSLQVFGCNPDICIYPDTFARPNPVTTPFRSAGGHIHIGFPPELMEAPFMRQALVFLLDATLGLASVYGLDTETARQRKKLYGRAGYARLYDDRLEYRVLPAAFLTSNEEVAVACFATAQRCAEWLIDSVHSGSLQDGAELLHGVIGEKRLYEVQRAINRHSVTAAKRLQRELQQLLPAELFEIADVLARYPVTEGTVALV